MASAVARSDSERADRPAGRPRGSAPRHPSPRSGYRPGLDGVRALAVIMVILYHDDISWAKGGFLGVDVFFVLSGYLITSLLLTERHATGRIGLVDFWTRRARRLLPALFLMLAGVAVYAFVLAQPSELRAIRSDGLATLLYVSNWKFIADGSSYFQMFQTPSPLQHTWSLAIEEQWYLVWPPVIVALVAVARSRASAVAGVCAGLAAASAAWMAWLFHTGVDPSRLYFGTDTRAQALLVGATFAALTTRKRDGAVVTWVSGRHSWIVQVAGAAGALTLAAMLVRTNSAGGFLYRGGFGLAAIAALGVVAAAAVDGPVARVLSIRPLRAIGAISYGLYLWHWPVDIAISPPHVHLSGAVLDLARAAVAGAIATFSYHVVEQPIRRHGLAAVRWWPRSLPRRALAPTMALVLVVALDASTQGAASAARLPNATTRINDGVVPVPSRARVLMLGDSQMFTLMFWDSGQFDESGPQYDPGALLGCGVFTPSVRVGGNCGERERLWNARVQTFDPDLSVLLIGAWEVLDFSVAGHRYVHGTPEHERELERLVTTAVRTLTSRHGHVALLEVPCFGQLPTADGSAQIRDDPAAVANVNTALRAVAARDPREITFVPWADAVCPNGSFAAKIHGIVVRPDGVHYGSTPAAKIAADALAPVLLRLGDAARDARARH